MSILLAFQGAPPAEPDLIDLFVDSIDLFEAPDDDPGFFIAADIFDDVPIFQLADILDEVVADDLASFVSDFVDAAAQDDLIFAAQDDQPDEPGDEIASFVQDLIFDVQAADDLIQLLDDVVADEPETELLGFTESLIEDDAPLEAQIVAAAEDEDAQVEGFTDLLIEEDAPIDLASAENEPDDLETPDCFFAADVFLPDEQDPIIVFEDAFLQDDEVDPLESFALADAPDDPFVPDPGELVETWDSVVFVPRPDDPNRNGLYIASHAEFDDIPTPPSSGEHYTVSGPDVGRAGLSAWFEYDIPGATLGTQRRTV